MRIATNRLIIHHRKLITCTHNKITHQKTSQYVSRIKKKKKIVEVDTNEYYDFLFSMAMQIYNLRECLFLTSFGVCYKIYSQTNKKITFDGTNIL